MLPERPARPPWALTTAGVVVLVAGIVFALRTLPELRSGPIPTKSILEQRFEALREQLGFTSLGPVSRIELSTRTVYSDDDTEYFGNVHRTHGTRGAEWLSREGRGFYLHVTGPVRSPAHDHDLDLNATYSVRGELVSIEVFPRKLGGFTTTGSLRDVEGFEARALEALRRPGEQYGEPHMVPFSGQEFEFRDLTASGVPNEVPESIFSTYLLNNVFIARRTPTALRTEIERGIPASVIAHEVIASLQKSLFVVIIAVLFIALITRRRIGFVNGLILGGIALSISIPTLISELEYTAAMINRVFLTVALPIWIFIAWSVTESWLRSVTSQFSTTLDTLRAGVLGPTAGRSLVAGWSMGAAIAGVHLALFAASTRLPWVWPADAVIYLPLLGPVSPFYTAVVWATAVLLAYALAQLAPAKLRHKWVAALIAAVFLGPRVELLPSAASFAAALILSYLLIETLERYGLTATLTAAVAGFTLPAAIFALMQFQSIPGTAGTLTAIAFLPLVLGIIGAQRPAGAEENRLGQPRFIQRIQEERRLKYEMDLLARMQLGLLPEKMPVIPGWNIAARTILATEVGGDLYDFVIDDQENLWVAMGDVSGHGFSCSVAQAMTKAGLLSLIDSSKTPAAVLNRLDQVLRAGTELRTFTALALMKLDPATGLGLISGGGNPFPVLMSDGETREIEIPELPLGLGPARVYRDRELEIQPDSTLLVWSDGLHEARGLRDEVYGFDRPIEIARSVFDRPAEKIVERLLDDWQTFVAGGAVEDDTTVLVVQRIGR